MKKILLLIITSLMLALCAFSAGAVNLRKYEETDWLKIVDGVVYCLGSDGKHYYVSDYFATDELAKTATEINIVSTVDGKPVKGISVDYLISDSFLTVEEITIPEGIEYIRERAFSALDSLKTVELPDTVTQIGEGAFSRMENLGEITLPSSITRIPSRAFFLCSNLKNVNIKGEITSVGQSAFYGCKKITAFDFSNLKFLWESAFEASGLVEAYIPKSVEFSDENEIYSYFKNCKSLKRVVFEDRYTEYFTLDAYFFKGCTALEEVVLPDAKKIRVSTEAFANCDKLRRLTGTDRIYSVGSKAFYNCGLDEITLCGDIIFNDYSIDEAGREIVSVFENSRKLRRVIFKNSDNLEKFVLPYKIFKGCTALERVVLPLAGKEIIIEERAFYGCSSLVGVYNTATVSSIGKMAFYKCTSLGSFTVPEKVTELYTKTFYGCKNLKNLYLHDGIKKIQSGNFSGCPRLKDISYEGTKTQYSKIKKAADIKRYSGRVEYKSDYQPLLENVKASVKATSVTLSWKKDKNASGYRLYMLDKGKLRKIADTADTKYTFKNLAYDTDYTLFVRAYTVKAGKKLLDPQKECVLVTTGSAEVTGLVHSKVNSKSLSLSWNKVDGASGYRVFIMKNGSWTKLCDTASLSRSITGLSEGTEYLFSVRAKEKAGKTVCWSDMDFITVKTRPSKVQTLKAKKVKDEEVTLSWKAVDGADGYSVYRKDANGNWKIIREHTSKDTYTVKNLASDTRYTFAVRSYTNLKKGLGYEKNYNTEYTTVTVKTDK